MMNIISWVTIIVGVVIILISMLTFKRKGEAELSANVIETPMFRIGAVIAIIGILIKIISIFF